MRASNDERSIRDRALDRLDPTTVDWDDETVDAHKLVQELRIHQIVLEIQNDELRQAQQQLSAIAEQYSDLYEFAPIGYLTLDKNTSVRRVNLTAASMLGVSREKLNQKPLITRVPPRYHGLLNTHVRAVLAGKEPPACELEIAAPGGKSFWVALSSTLESTDGTEPLCRVTLTDISALKKMERALHDNEEKYRLIAENTIDCIWQMDMELRFHYVNAVILSALGYRQNEWVGSNLADHCPPADLNRIRSLITAAAAGGGSSLTFEADLYHRDGRLIPFEITGKMLFDEEGHPVGLQGVARNNAERKRAEEEIRKFKMLAESANYGVLIVALTGEIAFCNTAFAEMHGYRSDEIVGNSLASLQSEVDWSPVATSDSGTPAYRELSARQMRHRRKDGTDFDVLLNCTLVRQETGEPSFLAITATDITELKSLESQLRQSQKMEAIGQLVGGVAHDFNNLLTVIVNRADFIQEALPEGTPPQEDATEIAEAGMRGAVLIRQLLAFSRKQHLNIQRLDVNEILRGVENLLQRLIGEDISLVMDLASEPCVICADAGQLEQVIINLAVNARDAMPGGGLLTIATNQVCRLPEDATETPDPEQPPPGRYVTVSFSDTGYGMDAATQAQIFDPFFTTKDVGQGTGLGLSTVYGIIRQHRGFVHVHSETDKGTTFRILIPSQEKAAEEIRWVAGDIPLPRGDETVLLVDDEPSVRRVSARMLRDLGYRVLEAGSGRDGLNSARQHKHEIALLLTDIVMPEMDGKQLAERAAVLVPHLKVVFTSGYPEVHLKLRNAWVKDRPLLQKPFFIAELATVVRRTLDAA